MLEFVVKMWRDFVIKSQSVEMGSKLVPISMALDWSLVATWGPSGHTAGSGRGDQLAE